MAIGIGLHCWYCDHGPCTNDCFNEKKSVDEKVKEVKPKESYKHEYEVYIRTINGIIKETEERVKRLDKLKEVSKQSFDEWYELNKK